MGRARRGALAIVVSALLGVGLAGITPAGALTSTSQPTLTLNRLIHTTPFDGTSVKVRDNEAEAYVASDDSLWMADDNSNAIYEINRTTGALKREISQTTFINSVQLGGTATAGQSRSEDLEALAYDANADILYAFSGSTSAIPTVYRLTRDANHVLQIDSWRSLPSEWTGAGWRLADGTLYVGNGSSLRSFDYATGMFGPTFSISGLSKILGIDFDDVTGDLLAVTKSNKLYRASMNTRTMLPGWNGIDLTGFGMKDTRAVEVIGEQVFVSDGYDYRKSTDPMNHAIFVFDVAGPGSPLPAPVASFTTTTSSGTVPLDVSFTDTSTGSPTSWSWTFGDSGTSTSQNPSHTYTTAGTFTATLTASNANGSTTASTTITVHDPAGDPPVASFTTTTSSGTVPLDVSFTDTSTGSPTSWSWTFGDSGTSASQNPSHTYTTAGTFTATLTASNANGSTTASTTITVYDAPPPGLTVTLDADTYFNTSSPTKNYGTYPVLKLHSPATAEYRPIVKFTVSGLSGAPSSVKLRLYVTDGSVSGGDWYLVSNAWTETDVNWNNKPDVSGSPVGSAGAVTTGTWVEIDLTGAVTSDGTYSFEATSSSSNTAQFSSREGGNPPQLVIVP